MAYVPRATTSQFFIPAVRLLLAALLLTGGQAITAAAPAAAQPNHAWGDGALLIGTIDDCFGPASQTDAAEVTPCQSYAADLYESLQYTGATPEPADDTDIRVFRIGADDDFLYVEWDLAGAWDSDTAPSHQYIIEIDVDPDAESRGDAYVSIYGKTEFDRASWVDAQREGGFEAYADNADSGTANDVGGDQPGTGDPSCTDCPDDPGGQDGYTGKICDSEDRVYARVADGNVQLAMRWTCLRDSADSTLAGRPAAFRVRGWTSQSSSIEKDKLYWHDENPIADLSDEDFDNVPWFSTGGSGCAGDCDGDGQVNIGELIAMVGIALDTAPIAQCAAGDGNGDGAIRIDELLLAVTHALAGCGG